MDSRSVGRAIVWLAVAVLVSGSLVGVGATATIDDDLGDAVNDTDDDLDDATNDTDDATNETTDDVDETTNETTETINETADDTIETVDDTTDDTTEPIDDTTETTDDTTETIDELDDATDEPAETIDNATDETVSTVDDSVGETAETIDGTIDDVNETSGDLADGSDDLLEPIEGEVDGAIDADGPIDRDATSEESATDGGSGDGAAGDGSAENENASADEGADPGADEAASADESSIVGGAEPPSGARAAADAALVGLLGLVTVSGAAGAAAGGSSAGAAGGATASYSPAGNWYRRLRRVAGRIPWESLPASILRYSRYDDSDPLENDRRRRIYEAIEDDPGLYLSAVSEESDVALSTVRHHVRVLEDENLLRSEKVRGKRRYYPIGAADVELQAALEEPATRAIVERLDEVGRAHNGRLADDLGRDPSTISHHLSSLEEDGLVVRERDGRAIVNELAPAVERALAGERSAGSDRERVPADD